MTYCPTCSRGLLQVFNCNNRVSFIAPNENGNAEVHCLGQSGYAPLMKGISRITIKLKDVPGSNADPLERLCLKNATTALN